MYHRYRAIRLKHSFESIPKTKTTFTKNHSTSSVQIRFRVCWLWIEYCVFILCVLRIFLLQFSFVSFRLLSNFAGKINESKRTRNNNNNKKFDVKCLTLLRNEFKPNQSKKEMVNEYFRWPQIRNKYKSKKETAIEAFERAPGY